MTKFERAKKAIEELFGDTSVSPEETLDHLTELRSELDIQIEAVKEMIPGE